MHLAILAALAAAVVGAPAPPPPHGIAYLAARDAFIRAPNGSVRRLTRHHDVDGLSWSPDRKSVLLMRMVEFEPTDYRVTRYELTSRRERTYLAHAFDPAWSPGARRVAFARGNDLWVADPTMAWSGEKLVELGFEPAWSPDGSRLAYKWAGLWIIDADGTGATQLTTTDDRSPAWAPDGRMIAFVRWSPLPWIWTMHPDGSGQRRLVPGTSPTWSPDGRRIAFAQFDDDQSDLASVARNGRGLRRITRTPRISEVPFDWR